MIVRGVIDDPSLVNKFDFPNDGKDTIRWLASRVQYLADQVDKYTSQCDHLQEQTSAWRKACRLIYDGSGEGGKNGRPIDAFDRATWHAIVDSIAEAERLEGVLHES